MIKIEDIGELIPERLIAGLSDAAINGILGNVAAASRDYWVNLASEDNSSFRHDYINGIQPVNLNKGIAIISLVGAIPHLLENGSDALDMRTTLLGPNVPVVPRGDRGAHLNKDGKK